MKRSDRDELISLTLNFNDYLNLNSLLVYVGP